MKKKILTLTIILACTAMVALFCGRANAAVTGVCSNCHTMHSSQSGAPAAWTDKGWVAGETNGVLLVSNCAGCHAQGGSDHVASGDVPQVYHTSDTDLAGGNFGYIDYLGSSKGTAASDAKGHNVNVAISALGEDGLLTAPPGDEFTTGITNANFTCAGTKGCHGDRSVEDEGSSLSGAHHGDDSSIDGSTVPKSYRFLLGVNGVENNVTNPWENTVTNHNKYQGVDKPDTESTGLSATNPGADKTISGFCGECHGDFHGTGADGHGTSAAWLRHPTDILLPNAAPYNVNITDTTFDPLVPVAYTDPGTPARAEAVVMCLSCHGVHGTNYSDILRWEYTMSAGSGGSTNAGCFKCHDDKE